MSATDDLLRNNERHAAGFDERGVPARPAKRVAVVSCMDARIDLHEVLGLEVGDAHLIRNAGGVITGAEIRSLSISQHEMGTEEILVIQHTGCGLLTFTDEEFRARLPDDPEWSAETFTDLDQSVRESVARLMADPFIPNKGSIRGFVYDVETGKLREVD